MQLSTTTVGSGSRTAALVHGMTATSHHWTEFARLLADEHDCTVTLVDLRGHGESPRGDRYHVSDFSDDLVDTLPTGLDFLIGQSLGGRAVMDAADRLLPKHLIALDPGLKATKWFEFALRHLFALQFKMPDRVMRRAILTKAGRNRPDADEVIGRIRAGWTKFDPAVRLGLLETVADIAYVVQPPAVPSILVKPVKSIVVPQTLVDELTAVGWDVRVLPGVTHELHVQDPAGVLRLIADVLAEPATR